MKAASISVQKYYNTVNRSFSDKWFP